MNDYRGRHSSPVPWANVSAHSSRYRSRHQTRNHRRRNLIILGIVLVFVVLLVPLVSARIVRVDRISLTAEDLPADISHLRIVYVTDIHYGYWFSDAALSRLVGQIKSLNPDIVLFGGDYATDNASAIQFFKKLPSLHARYMVLGVIGESDRGDSDLELSLLEEAMINAGVVPLVNDVKEVRCPVATIWVAGLDDPLTGSPDVKSVASRVSASDYVILLCHNPSIISEARQAVDRSGALRWFDLGLFGHTHGGQVWGLSSLLDIANDVPEQYRYSMQKEQDRAFLLISNGVGTSVVPFRLFCPPQIHCIDIATK